MAEELRVHSIMATITTGVDKFGTEFVNRTDNELFIRKIFISMSASDFLVNETCSIEVGHSPIYSTLAVNDGQTVKKVNAHLTSNEVLINGQGKVEKYLFARGEWPLEPTQTIYAHAGVTGGPTVVVSVDIWYHF